MFVNTPKESRKKDGEQSPYYVIRNAATVQCHYCVNFMGGNFSAECGDVTIRHKNVNFN